jgi:hypothetical protein
MLLINEEFAIAIINRSHPYPVKILIKVNRVWQEEVGEI